MNLNKIWSLGGNLFLIIIIITLIQTEQFQLKISKQFDNSALTNVGKENLNS